MNVGENFIAMNYATDLKTLFFPKYCSSCNRNLMHFESAICMHCLSNLPRALVHDDHNDREVGERLGALFAHELMESDRMKDMDIILPVPLHPKKLHLRGYNQCDCIAKGMAETWGIEISQNNLTRTHFTQSQTRRGRISRWSNMKDVFWLREPEKLQGKRVLLIDDVITTGATIEACATALNKVRGLELSVGALAIPSA